ncbi:hypothetical protein HDU76_013423 [Blyttiomyces sp. JEL0837]|nr:hypothetical protein HDU76_013423 [Blyttiomyces sp. JEL0837]
MPCDCGTKCQCTNCGVDCACVHHDKESLPKAAPPACSCGDSGCGCTASGAPCTCGKTAASPVQKQAAGCNCESGCNCALQGECKCGAKA